MLLWVSGVIRGIRSGNDVSEVLPGKWSELCLLDKRTVKMVLWGILGHQLDEELHRKAVMVGVLEGAGPAPAHPSHVAKGRGKDMCTSYGRYYKQGQASFQHQISKTCNENPHPGASSLGTPHQSSLKLDILCKQMQNEGGGCVCGAEYR